MDEMPRCERCGLELEGYECPVHGCRTTPDPYAELESCPGPGLNHWDFAAWLFIGALFVGAGLKLMFSL